MKINKLVTIALMVLSVISFQAARAQSLPTSIKWHWDKVTPCRAAPCLEAYCCPHQ